MIDPVHYSGLFVYLALFGYFVVVVIGLQWWKVNTAFFEVIIFEQERHRYFYSDGSIIVEMFIKNSN